jgi:CheY-like chemotaxis protein
MIQELAMARVVIAEASPTQARQLRFVLEEAGFAVELVGGGAAAMGAIDRLLPDVVLTDLEMPDVNGLQLVEHVRRNHPAVPVVLMTTYGSEGIAALALQKGAASYVPKRYLTQDIVPTLRSILSVAPVGRGERRVIEFLARSEFQFALENDETLIPSFVSFVEEYLTRVRLCDDTALIRVCVALREALMNAMHHGNLEVASDLRERDDGSYFNLVASRRQQEPYRSRRVHVMTTITPELARFTIRDEGPGFDPSQLADPTDPANLEKVSGRGMLLIHTFMDEVSHNANGNEIVMVKRGE